ncbi:MAG: hypothetical protein PWR16_2049, partial [Methanoculleus sp.]|nr:hypothetical protein [Methanoculleus sp.]
MNRRTFRQFHSERLHPADSRSNRNIACLVYGFRGAIAERGVGTKGSASVASMSTARCEGGILPPPHLTVVELRSFAPSVLTLLPSGQSRFG